jgi:FkbM family methyltransferase
VPVSVSARSVAYLGEEIRTSLGLRNWVSYLMAQLVGKSPTLTFWNGFRYRCASISEGRALAHMALEGVQFQARCDRDQFIWGLDQGILTTPTGLRFHLRSATPIAFLETFHYDIHFAGNDLRGQTVLDGGAFVGDTALYFAQRGAEVLAYEPDPTNMAYLRANLELNPDLARQISPHAEALGTEGKVTFHSGLRGASGMHAKGGVVIQAPSVTLESALAGRTRAYLFKSDCKGAEFALVKQPALGRFDRLAIEYTVGPNTGPLIELVNTVEKHGFRWRIRKQNSLAIPLKEHGLLEARKVSLGSPGPVPF